MTIKSFIFYYFKLNIYELNFILCIVGFSAYTSFLPESFPSILYRAFALAVSVVCILKNRSHLRIPHDNHVRFFILILILLSFRIFYEVIVGDISDLPYASVKTQILLMTFGVSLLPTISVLLTYKKINWFRTFVVILVVLLLMLTKALISINSLYIDEETRFELNSRQSTLVFGDNSGRILLLASSILLSKNLNEKNKFIKILCIVSIFVGVMGLARAASRGPFVSTLVALLFLITVTSRRIKTLFVSGLILASFSIAAILKFMADAAPVLFMRMSYTIEEGDTNGRVELAKRAFDLIVDNPIFGTNFLLVSSEGFNSYHNMYLSTMVGLGVVLGFAFIIFIIQLLYKALRLRNRMYLTQDFFFLSIIFYISVRGITGITLTIDAINNIFILFGALTIRRLSTLQNYNK